MIGVYFLCLHPKTKNNIEIVDAASQEPKSTKSVKFVVVQNLTEMSFICRGGLTKIFTNKTMWTNE